MHCTRIPALGAWGILAHICKNPEMAVQIFRHFFMPTPCFLIPSFSATLALHSALNGCSPRWIGAKVPLSSPIFEQPFFAFSVKFVSIIRRSCRKCALVTDHEKLIATLSHNDRPLRGAWDILNGVLEGPTQAEKNWVIHIAYYLKKLKEEGVCIEMEVNAPQPEWSTPRHQEHVKVDPWHLYVQAY